MSAEGVPPDVAELLRVHIESYEALEMALLLARRADDAWRPNELAKELGLAGDTAVATLEDLTTTGLVSREGRGHDARFRVCEASRPLLDRLQLAYRDHRVELMGLMTTHALDRVRTSALRAFAQAFLVRDRRDDR